MATAADQIEFWKNINKRLDEMRVKASVLSETYLTVGETGLAKDAHTIGGSILTLMGASETRIRNLETREKTKMKEHSGKN